MRDDNPTKEKGPSVEVDWDRIEALSDGRKVGQLGGFWYLLDDEKSPLSNGYHELSVERPNLTYRGRTGNFATTIELTHHV